MIYKTLKKVSDYCQLVDKRKFPETTTTNGITFTNNGDGTITPNGTAPSTAFFLLFKYTDSLMPKHKYLLSGSPNDASVNAYIQCYDDTNFQWLIDTGGGGIATFPKQVVNPSGATNIRIRIEGGYTANNLIFKPQLFDLTEMYGAGNEPTTVEEFRQDFPEEMYDYKPYCFVKSYKTLLKASDNKIITSYKKSLICTTKNLFDISKVPTISSKLTVKDNSICSYDYPVVTNDTNLLSIFKSLKPNTNYTMSATTLNYLDAATNYIVLIFSNANDDKIIFYNYSAGFNKVTFSLTQEQINNITYVYFYGRDESSGGPAIWNNVQIELGDTATEYHPYGYL